MHGQGKGTNSMGVISFLSVVPRIDILEVVRGKGPAGICESCPLKIVLHASYLTLTLRFPTVLGQALFSNFLR